MRPPLDANVSFGHADVLDPAGPAAREIASLGWLMFVTAGLVFVLVVAFLFVALRRARQNETRLPDAPLAVPQRGRRVVIWAGAIVPAVILTVVFGFTVRSLVALAGPPERGEAITVQVIGHQFWWEMRYLTPGNPEVAAVTANEMLLPVGERVRVELTSDDVIHSFWIPSLHGKMDTIPNQLNRFWIQADRLGLYQGPCAEFCGAQHANMYVRLRAVPLAEFEAWMDAQRQSALPASTESAVRGREIFTQRGCANCHSIRGVSARSNLGPDLTHLASRETLGAGMMPNNRGNLSGWILNAQGVKRGSLMPPFTFNGRELDDLLNYLEGLE